MGIFNIINTSASRLAAAQQALDVIGQNIANANTPGYSRQRADLVTRQFTGVAALSTRPLDGVSLNGVEVADVVRIKSTFLQNISDTAVGQQSSLNAQVLPLAQLEQTFGEPGDDGLQKSLDKFYAAWSNLATTDPTSNSAGAAVLGAGTAVASQLHTMSNGVATNWDSQLTTLNAIVSQANIAAKTVAGLNEQIATGLATGENVNVLQDQRDVLVTSLSNLVGGTSILAADGTVSVSVGGTPVVSGISSLAISVTGTTDISTATTDPVTLRVPPGIALAPTAGQAAGLLTALGSDLPSLSASLDGIANTLKDAVNGLQGAGFTISGDPGTDFFSGTGARDISVALTAPGGLAVSAIQGTVDGSNAQKIADLAVNATAASTLGGPGPSEQWQNLTYSIGVQVNTLNTAIAAQTKVVTASQSAVTSDSGVNLDEELANMLTYQRSYQASSKVITVVDEMLQTLIGMVN